MHSATFVKPDWSLEPFSKGHPDRPKSRLECLSSFKSAETLPVVNENHP